MCDYTGHGGRGRVQWRLKAARIVFVFPEGLVLRCEQVSVCRPGVSMKILKYVGFGVRAETTNQKQENHKDHRTLKWTKKEPDDLS